MPSDRRGYMRAWGKTPSGQASQRASRQRFAADGRKAESDRRWIAKNRKKKRAGDLIRMRIYRGTLVRPDTCSECGNTGRIHGHHDDYDKPTEVRWLCHQCHVDWHKENGEGENAYAL